MHSVKTRVPRRGPTGCRALVPPGVMAQRWAWDRMARDCAWLLAAALTTCTVSAQEPASVGRHQPVEGGEIIARVGSEVILAAEVAPAINEWLANNGDKIPAAQHDDVRLKLMQKQLPPLIDVKLVYADARRTIPEENFPQVEKQLDERYEEVQVPKMLEKFQLTNRAQLDDRLRELGSSMALHKRAFIERVLAQQWMAQSIEIDDTITHERLWNYYQAHLEEFQFDAKARWEEIVARFDRFESKQQAWAAIANWGNEIQSGSSFADVARRYSHGVTAHEGGRYDWTTRGSLVSEVLNTVIFTLPPGQLSQILELESSFRIVRVIERREAGTVPFVEAQPEIREQIKKQRRKDAIRGYLDQLRGNTRVWTIFDDQPAAAAVSQG